MPRPLVVTSDPSLLDDLLRLAAAAGAEPDVADHVAAAVALWRAAPLVLLGIDLVEDATAAPLPRRPGLVVVGVGPSEPTRGDVWRYAVGLGAEHVVFLPDAQSWVVDRLADAGDAAPPGVVVASIGARGGAGATSFAVAFALACARQGRRTMLVDTDPYGGGIDLVLGVEEAAGPRWDDVASGVGPLAGEALAAALPRCGEVTVLSWSREPSATVEPDAVESLLTAARRGAGVVVVDVPRSFDAASRVALSAADLAYVVCPAEVRAMASGRRVVAALRPYVDDVRAVVRGPSASHLSGGVVADSLGVPCAGWLRPEPGIELDLDEGRPPGRANRGPLARLCMSLSAELGT